MNFTRPAVLISILAAILLLSFPVQRSYAALIGGTVQGRSLNLTNATATVTTLAGSAGSLGSADGTGTVARFVNPYGITTDGKNLYVADTNAHTIRKIVIATGVVTTLAGSAGNSGSDNGTGPAARFNCPVGITTDGANLYVGDQSNRIIRKIVISTREVTTLAGTAGISGSADGTGPAARFDHLWGITTDGTNLYVGDSNNTIRMIVIATGEVTTLAGSADIYGSEDGTGTAARFYTPAGITTDGTNLYVADSNHIIRKIVIATREVTTLAGLAGSNGPLDGTGSAARFDSPAGITTDGTNLYVSDGYDQLIRKIVIATREVTTLAGSAVNSGFADGTGSKAKFSIPMGITTDGANLYICDRDNSTIRKVSTLIGGAIQGGDLNLNSTNAYVTTIAGSPGNYGTDNGTGSTARFYEPFGMTTDGTNLYIGDAANNIIRKIVIATGAVTTLAGQPGIYGTDDGTGTAARFRLPTGITTDGTNLYVVDTDNNAIRKIVIATGEVTTLAGLPGYGNTGSTDGTGTAARFNHAFGITTDGANLYVADEGNGTIRKIVIATKEVTTLAGTAGIFGSEDGTGTAAKFRNPRGITSDGTNLYVADAANSTIRQIEISTRVVTTLAGSAESTGAADGSGSAARFNYPMCITTDGTNLYVSGQSDTLRKVVIASREVTTLAGSSTSSGSTDGAGPEARFNNPYGITTDGKNLYLSDIGNHTIRQIRRIHTITASAVGGGTISPTATVEYGEDASFTITPNAHYHISDVIVDGTSVGVITSWSFQGVMNHHTITANFAIDTFSITTSVAGTNGTISPSKTANYGSNATFVIKPNANYYVDNLVVDGVSVDASDSFTFKSVSDNHTILATFAYIMTGDINNDKSVDLKDAIAVLKILSHVPPVPSSYKKEAGINGSRIQLSDAIFIMQEVAGLRGQPQ